YVGTLNKALFPGLRLGYAVVPQALAGAFANARQLMDRQPPTLTQAIVLDFMREGQFAAHIRRRRIAYKAQRDVLAAELSARLGAVMEVEVPDGGMHMIAYLKGDRSDLEVEAAAAEAGLSVRAISRLYRQAKPRSGLMLGFTGFPARAMAGGVARLEKALT
ncbi:MAG: aminotransferase class I/II-fold pyridoxal phosphate-dependent enzyme, partial [Caulobacteraceae bacterium]